MVVRLDDASVSDEVTRAHVVEIASQAEFDELRETGLFASMNEKTGCLIHPWGHTGLHCNRIMTVHHPAQLASEEQIVRGVRAPSGPSTCDAMLGVLPPDTRGEGMTAGSNVDGLSVGQGSTLGLQTAHGEIVSGDLAIALPGSPTTVRPIWVSIYMRSSTVEGSCSATPRFRANAEIPQLPRSNGRRCTSCQGLDFNQGPHPAARLRHVTPREGLAAEGRPNDARDTGKCVRTQADTVSPNAT